MKRHITLLTIALATVASMAQVANDTINRTVLIESTYNPIIAGAVKRNFIPDEVKPTMTKEQIVYANDNVDLTNFDREAKPATAIAIIPKKGTSGYAHLGYGNYNNLSALAAYKLNFGRNNGLAIKAFANGWNGKFRLDKDNKWHSHRYDMGGNADYKTQLADVTLKAGIHAAYYNYNYITKTLPNSATSIQQANNLGAYIGVNGLIREAFIYDASVHYIRTGRSTHFANKTPHNENHLQSELTLGMDLYNWGMTKMLVRSDVLGYQGLENYNNYHALGITPIWDYRHGNLHLVAGFNMDFLMGKNIKNPMQASPECSVSYISDGGFTAKIILDGGRDINTFAHLYALSPYWATKKQVLPTYTFMNSRIEGNLRIIEGLHLNIGGGYKILGDALFETTLDSTATTYTNITNHNAQVATIDAAISYNYKELISISGKGAYYYWMMKGDRALLTRTPQLDIDFDARVRIIPNLYAHTNLDLIMFTGINERSIIDWSLGANYVLNNTFSFFLDAHNLLNHRHQYYTGYPAQGFNVLVGAMIKF